MHGKEAFVNYKGEIYSFIVACDWTDTQDEVNDIGLRKLKSLEETYPELDLKEIVKRISNELL
ncbi:hypothetical protein [Priestia megaterium]|uniref:hypothetical protein n=1 Tax=Priestia megaterium TaxID=1404 RepID=UPI0035B58A82